MSHIKLKGVAIVETFAEAFPMVGTRIVITAPSLEWALIAARTMTGFATSVIACGAEAGIERTLSPDETLDGRPGVAVDIHVHRVTNRWGYVHATTPEGTMAAVQESLPKKFWIELNSLLVPFGKHVCTGRAPKCSTCPVLDMCPQVGVMSHR